MKAHYHRTTFTPEGPIFDPELCLRPENDRDRELLEQIEKECVTKGCGRFGDDLRLQHVRIRLEGKDAAHD